MQTTLPSSLLTAIYPDVIESIDQRYVERFNELVEAKIAEALTPKALAEAQGWRLRADLGALCFDGNPDAPVVYLQANPSYGDDATRLTHYQPHPSHPLSVTGHHIHPPTRTYYHDEVFRHLLQEGVTLDQLGNRLLKVELCPWASKKWPGRGELERELGAFPSRRPIAEFVQHLADRGALFIMARAWSPWFKAVPALEPLIGTRVFKSKAPVSPYISRGSYPDGFDSIVSALRS